ncbi:MAG: GAF domain-containing protein [Ignavibacteriae bacterium]|nr:GAF domain-containing protein [Ignavibacteriota bacterium]
MKLNEILSENQSVNIEKVPDSGHRVSADTVAPIYGSRAQDLEMVLSITRKINTSLVLSDVLSLVLDHAIRITRAERGFIMLADSTGALQYMNGLDREGKVIHPESFQISSSVLEDVFRTGESMCVEDALHD